MQAPAAGCTGMAPPPGAGGAGSTLEVELTALLSGSSAPATPNAIAKAMEVAPHTTATVLRARFVTTTNCRYSSRDAHSDTECFSRALRESDCTGGGRE
jgi:hypothetical protein